MLQKELIQKFLAHPEIGVLGVSRKGDLPSNLIYKKLKSAGYQAYAINPNATTIDGDPCYRKITDLPGTVKAMVLAGTPQTSLDVIDDCVRHGVEVVWMHRGMGNGSFSEEAMQKAQKHRIEVITNGCPMMFIPKVDFFHKVFKWVKS